MSVSVTRTRQSVGSQLREAFDGMIERGIIKNWGIEGGTGYTVTFATIPSLPMNPGRAMDFVAMYGYDVRFGAATLCFRGGAVT